MHSFGAISARAEASRINGAKSRGPKTEEGRARSARNALKHGLRAQKLVVLPDEDAANYEAQEAALLAELAPEGALQTLLARRVAAAAWRLVRADRMEVELFAQQGAGDGDLGLALIRDCNGARAFPTLLRYRGAAEAGLWRALKALKALQAEATAMAAAGIAPMPMSERNEGRLARDRGAHPPDECRNPNEPDTRATPGAHAPLSPPGEPVTASIAGRPEPVSAPRGQELHLGAIGTLLAPEGWPSSPYPEPGPVWKGASSPGSAGPAPSWRRALAGCRERPDRAGHGEARASHAARAICGISRR